MRRKGTPIGQYGSDLAFGVPFTSIGVKGISGEGIDILSISMSKVSKGGGNSNPRVPRVMCLGVPRVPGVVCLKVLRVVCLGVSKAS